MAIGKHNSPTNEPTSLRVPLGKGGGVDRLEEVNASFRHGFDENRDKKNEAGWIVVSINYLQLAF